MPAQDDSSTVADPQDLITKFQQSIAEKVSTTPPVTVPIDKDGEAGKIDDNFQAQSSKLQKDESVKLDEKVVSVKSVEDLPKLIEPVEIAAPSSSVTNPNAILELTKADIFKLLGMFKIPEAEKKKNLDEMEETIWADFVEEDLPEMLREDQKEPFREFLKTSPSAEKIINFFGNPPIGGLPANFEEKYLAKTLEFKAEIAKEQIETLLAAADDVDKKKILEQAKAAASSGQWKQVEDLMVNFG